MDSGDKSYLTVLDSIHHRSLANCSDCVSFILGASPQSLLEFSLFLRRRPSVAGLLLGDFVDGAWGSLRQSYPVVQHLWDRWEPLVSRPAPTQALKTKRTDLQWKQGLFILWEGLGRTWIEMLRDVKVKFGAWTWADESISKLSNLSSCSVSIVTCHVSGFLDIVLIRIKVPTYTTLMSRKKKEAVKAKQAEAWFYGRCRWLRFDLKHGF